MSETTDRFNEIKRQTLDDLKKRRETLDRAIQQLEAELEERQPPPKINSKKY